MISDLIIPAIGYVASVLLAISLLVTNYIRFRWLNTCGNIFFISYGLLIGAVPIIVTNSILFLINIFYLIKIYNAKEDFDLIEFKGGEKLVHKFLAFYKEDIEKYFPAYTHDENENNLKFVVLRDLVIANIFIADLDDAGNAVIALNYTVAKYRDYKVGEFIFTKELRFLIARGVKKLVYTSVSNKHHAKFIRVMGFVKQDDGSYIKEL